MKIVEIPIKINLSIQNDKVPVPLDISNNNEAIQFGTDVKIEPKFIGAEEYDGSYTITPLAYEDQVLETENKLCVNDIVVKRVPKWKTSNTSGGYTFYIAEEV